MANQPTESPEAIAERLLPAYRDNIVIDPAYYRPAVAAALRARDEKTAELKTKVMWLSGISDELDALRERKVRTEERCIELESQLRARDERIGELEAAQVKLWECPTCGFSFDACHEDEGGGYTCPSCKQDELEALIRELLETHRVSCQAKIAGLEAKLAALTALPPSAEPSPPASDSSTAQRTTADPPARTSR